jgi:predicted metal-dependent hydrolase
MAKRRARLGEPKYELPRRTRANYLKHREAARVFVHERLEYFNKHYGFRYGRVSIKDTTSRWGSCSRLGNLNFSYRLVLLPRELADYVIVHELCHLKQFDHSQKFWDLVAEQAPEYKRLRKELRAGSLS